MKYEPKRSWWFTWRNGDNYGACFHRSRDDARCHKSALTELGWLVSNIWRDDLFFPKKNQN